MNAYDIDFLESDIERVFEAFPEIESEHLRLRQLQPEDAAALFDIFSDEAVTRYYDLYPYSSVDEAEEMVEFFADAFFDERSIRWGIARKSDNVIIGTCGYVWLRRFRGEVGYDLAQAYWRQGIMTEALNAILDFGFQELKLNRIEALVMTGNVASAGLLTSLGFVEEGTLREHDFFKGQFHDMRCFSLLEREFYENA